jgi:hypothetical protein
VVVADNAFVHVVRYVAYGDWGHNALMCGNRFNHVYQADDSRSGNSVTSNHRHDDHPQPHLYMDTGATDHLTVYMERLSVQEHYYGRDQVQAANGAGLSISNVGRSRLAGPMNSLALKNILHVLDISKN